MMDHASEDKLAKVHPLLASKVRQMAENLAAEGLQIIVSQGLRTWQEQHDLWQKGRNPDGSYIDPVHHTGVVTNADAGHSWHNFGLAVDCAPDDPTKAGFQIDWNADHPQWKRMERAGVSLGLTSGANWKRIVDVPHFQITGRFPENAPDDEVRQIYKDGGLFAVWNAVVPIEEHAE